MSNRIKKLLILILGVALGILIHVKYLSIPCLFHTLFKIPCPGCGMTRAFRNILSFNFAESISYNILGIPFFIFLIFLILFFIYDIIKDKNTVETKVIKFLEKYAIVIIILLVVSISINIYRGI